MREILVGSVQPRRMAHLSPFDGETDRARARRMVDENVDLACGLLAQAADRGCNIVCYPEDLQGIAHYGYYLDDPELLTGFVETVPGPTTERIAAVARQRGIHVVFAIFERVGDRIYNTAVLMGPQGKILGTYHKVHMPAVERWSEARGDSFPVFETELGTVGMLICYDIMFPEAARCLVLNGAEILLNPTMAYDGPGQCEGNGLMRVRMRAIDNFVPVVVSLCGRGALIVASDGSVLAQGQPDREEIISATIDLDATPMDHSQWELFTGTADVKARFLQERLPDTYRALTMPCPPVLSRYQADGKRLQSSPEWIKMAYEEIRRRWSRTAS